MPKSRFKKTIRPVIFFVILLILVMPFKSPGPAYAATSNYTGVIGWDGDKDGVLAYMDGSFYLRDGKSITPGFGIYNNPGSLKWYNHSGYLPCLVTEFERDNCTVKLMNFGDKVTIGSYDYVAIYNRVAVYNHGTGAVTLDPAPSSGLLALTSNSKTVSPGQTVNHDYVIASDRFANNYAWPSDSALVAAGSWDTHFTHMRDYWNNKLSGIVQLNTCSTETRTESCSI
jgi:hypothetical protein